jgi:hypothetical protein
VRSSGQFLKRERPKVAGRYAARRRLLGIDPPPSRAQAAAHADAALALLGLKRRAG